MKGATHYYAGLDELCGSAFGRLRFCARCGRMTCGGFCPARKTNSMEHPEPHSACCDRCGAAWRARRVDVAPYRGEDVNVPPGVVWAGCGCRALWMEAA